MNLPGIPAVTHYPSPTVLPVASSEHSGYVDFNETISFTRASSNMNTSISFRSVILQNSAISKEMQVIVPEGGFGQQIIVKNLESKMIIKANPYDAGGFWTANDYDYILVNNKLNMFILRVEVSVGRYTYAQFKQGECEYEVQVSITPVGSNLSCGVPWLSIAAVSRPGSYEVALIDCYASTVRGLEQCDRFVEELTVNIE